MNEKMKPEYKPSIEELDDLSCRLGREIDNLETYGKDWNGAWIDGRDRAKYIRLAKKLAEIDNELEKRGAN